MMQLRSVMRGCAVFVLTAAMASGSAMADDEKKEKKAGGKDADPAAMMAAYQKAGEPAAEHKELLKQVGKWNLVIKSWFDPKQPPTESPGTAETKALLGDRFIQTTVSSTMMGTPFNGISTVGYDKRKKKFVGTWLDSMSTGITSSEATSSDGGKVFTTQMVGTDPVTGKQNKMKAVAKWESDDKIVEEFFERKGGKEIKSMEITYTRVK